MKSAIRSAMRCLSSELVVQLFEFDPNLFARLVKEIIGQETPTEGKAPHLPRHRRPAGQVGATATLAKASSRQVLGALFVDDNSELAAQIGGARLSRSRLVRQLDLDPQRHERRSQFAGGLIGDEILR